MRFRWRAALAVALVAGMGWAARHLQVDDTLIYARYVRNLLTGHGLVFNWGERVNALTSPLHTLLLVTASWLLHGNVIVAAWLLGVIFLAATAVLAERVAPFSGVFLAAAIYFEIFLGMETALFCFLLLLSVVAYDRGRWDWLPLLLCLVALTRFEGGALALAVAWQMLRRPAHSRVWPRWQAWVPVAVLVLLFFAANHSFYGRWLPSSGTAKLQQGLSGYWGQWPTAFFRLPRVFWRPLVSCFYVVPLVGWLAWRGAHTSKGRRWNRVVLPFLAILLAFYTLTNVPAYPWYYAPFVLFAIVYAGFGLPHTRWAYAGLTAVTLHLVVFGGLLLHGASALYANYRSVGAWLQANTQPGATVAAAETGTLGWYAPDHPVIDIVGLTTPRNATLLARHDTSSWLAEDKPDYVVMHTPAWVTGEAAVLQSPDYERLPMDWQGVYLMRRK
jgi:hypothetical protein